MTAEECEHEPDERLGGICKKCSALRCDDGYAPPVLVPGLMPLSPRAEEFLKRALEAFHSGRPIESPLAPFREKLREVSNLLSAIEPHPDWRQFADLTAADVETLEGIERARKKVARTVASILQKLELEED